MGASLPLIALSELAPPAVPPTTPVPATVIQFPSSTAPTSVSLTPVALLTPIVRNAQASRVLQERPCSRRPNEAAGAVVVSAASTLPPVGAGPATLQVYHFAKWAPAYIVK
jgi:hypothetical protein